MRVRGSPLRATGNGSSVGVSMHRRLSPAHRNHQQIRPGLSSEEPQEPSRSLRTTWRLRLNFDATSLGSRFSRLRSRLMRGSGAEVPTPRCAVCRARSGYESNSRDLARSRRRSPRRLWDSTGARSRMKPATASFCPCGRGWAQIRPPGDWLSGANRAMCVSLERSDLRPKEDHTHGL
jgi:hypothetical protein